MSNGNGRNNRIRKSQIISPYGVGAIVEFPDGTLMHAGLDAWKTSDEQNLADDRLAQRLGVRTFYEPVNAPGKKPAWWRSYSFCKVSDVACLSTMQSND